MIAWVLGAGLAFAGPAVRAPARMPYPVRLVYDASVERRCAARVQIDPRGRPTAIEPVDCPEVLWAFTRRRLARWRWERTDDGGADEVEVVYTPPVDALVPEEPAYWRRVQLGACGVRVVVEADGAARLHTFDPGCGPLVSPTASTPEALIRARAPEVCVVTFLATAEGPRAVDLFRCDLRARRHVRAMIEAWTWPTPQGDPTPFTVVLQLQGWPDGPRALP